MLEKLRVVLFVEDERWIAQGIELDLNAQGRTEESAIESLRATVALQAYIDKRAGREPFSKCRRARPELEALFDVGVPWSKAAPENQDAVQPPFDVREKHAVVG